MDVICKLDRTVRAPARAILRPALNVWHLHFVADTSTLSLYRRLVNRGTSTLDPDRLSSSPALPALGACLKATGQAVPCTTTHSCACHISHSLIHPMGSQVDLPFPACDSTSQSACYSRLFDNIKYRLGIRMYSKDDRSGSG